MQSASQAVQYWQRNRADASWKPVLLLHLLMHDMSLPMAQVAKQPYASVQPVVMSQVPLAMAHSVVAHVLVVQAAQEASSHLLMPLPDEPVMLPVGPVMLPEPVMLPVVLPMPVVAVLPAPPSPLDVVVVVSPGVHPEHGENPEPSAVHDWTPFTPPGQAHSMVCPGTQSSSPGVSPEEHPNANRNGEARIPMPTKSDLTTMGGKYRTARSAAPRAGSRHRANLVPALRVSDALGLRRS